MSNLVLPYTKPNPNPNPNPFVLLLCRRAPGPSSTTTLSLSNKNSPPLPRVATPRGAPTRSSCLHRLLLCPALSPSNCHPPLGPSAIHQPSDGRTSATGLDSTTILSRPRLLSCSISHELPREQGRILGLIKIGACRIGWRLNGGLICRRLFSSRLPLPLRLPGSAYHCPLSTCPSNSLHGSRQGTLCITHQATRCPSIVGADRASDLVS